MYSYEDRIKAVQLYEQYGKRAAAVIRELGYPDRHVLAKWYHEYVSKGDLKKSVHYKPKYSAEQRTAAVEEFTDEVAGDVFELILQPGEEVVVTSPSGMHLDIKVIKTVSVEDEKAG